MKLEDHERFIQQAREDYQGTPTRIARCMDACGETHVIIESLMEDGTKFYMDWIGAELASEPDEMEDCPFRGLKWREVK